MKPTITATIGNANTLQRDNTLRLKGASADEVTNLVTEYFPDATIAVNAAYTDVQLQRKHGNNLDRFLSEQRMNIINATGFEEQLGQWKNRMGMLGVSSIIMTSNLYGSSSSDGPVIDDNTRGPGIDKNTNGFS